MRARDSLRIVGWEKRSARIEWRTLSAAKVAGPGGGRSSQEGKGPPARDARDE
jgi:hypothetical protein